MVVLGKKRQLLENAGLPVAGVARQKKLENWKNLPPRYSPLKRRASAGAKKFADVLITFYPETRR